MSRKILHDRKKFSAVLGKRIEILLSRLNTNASKLAKSIGMTEAQISRIVNGKANAGHKFWRGIRRVYPAWEAFLLEETAKPPVTPYPQEEECMLPRKEHEAPDSGPGKLRLPQDLSDSRVVQQIIPEEGQRKRLHAKLDEILQSGNIGLVAAITCNLEEFARSAQKDRILETIGRKPGILPGGDEDNPSERPSPSSKTR
jgi:DNA-binding Xre family transcriptional regulator